ncbi:MAG: xanthine dehydrogenase molybdopterin binding subunit [Bacteroidia bacterium]|nr:xanthine dehydrogenase molybdopterin binding subunit [Bacteroidia bacterium]
MKNIPHESGIYHVTGTAVYVDDIPVDDNCLTGYVVYSSYSRAKIKSFDISRAINMPGIKKILSFVDIPGKNQMGPVFHDESVLAENDVFCIGQAIFLIAADNEENARKAAKEIHINFEELEPVLSIEQAMQKGELLQPQRRIECGDVEKALAASPHIIEGELVTGAQEHWYLETQASLCIPGEGNEMKVYSSTQNPSETLAIVAEILGIQKNDVEVVMRRIGGGFGGKETQANHAAAWAALLAYSARCPVKLRLRREDDQIITGKRHPFLIKYKAGFDNDGRISAIDFEQNCNGGYATDLTMAILERAMLHADNAYFVPNMRITGNAWKTNMVSNTAFRGFGGPQGMAGIETIIDRIAWYLKKDSADIRFINFYGLNDRNITPYGQIIENNRLYMLWERLLESSQYKERKKAVDNFNSENEFIKRGIALTPVKFGISFTTSFLNQAGALVNVYTDGSVLVNHGGTEMGQGLHTKIKQIAAKEFGIALENVKVNETNTSKVPNTPPTAASSGTDMNGMAVKNAIDKLKKRIASVIADEFNKEKKFTNQDALIFENNFIIDSKNRGKKILFSKAIPIVHLNRVSLSATGFYHTPGVHFNRTTGKGAPFYYYAFGMAVSEVEVDILTGYHRIIRADILHDTGQSINTAIDIGQIQGGFMQGVGWCTTEECKYDEKGNLLNFSPDTYKIPGVRDIPGQFNVNLLQGAPNPNTIHQSKAVGEPPFMLAFSVWLAMKYAVSAVGNHTIEPEWNIPMTNEKILLAIEKLTSNLK